MQTGTCHHQTAESMAPPRAARVVKFLKTRGINVRVKSTTTDEFLSKLQVSDITIDAAVFGAYLSGETGGESIERFVKTRGLPLPSPCTAEQAAQFLAVFPLRKLSQGPKQGKYALTPWESADLLLPLARWPKVNADRLAVARMLLECNGADPDCTIPKFQHWARWEPNEAHLAPLHLAADHGDRAMVELLLEFGATPDILDTLSRTPGDFAARNGHADIVEILNRAKMGPKKAKTGPPKKAKTGPPKKKKTAVKKQAKKRGGTAVVSDEEENEGEKGQVEKTPVKKVQQGKKLGVATKTQDNKPSMGIVKRRGRVGSKK
ncbi:hypothetical protein B0T26DRAFT_725748 [Lasiosphaeria miniovina]|uniref:Ankyrin n=1 Tax=Lasiosphaeria miniovina TaxID=1954250 RepID=A0AA39ZYX7_9PEZI|nr:uncharacterized protein B0T26DRAFT_725748 [Lasiosphaeria miniovina]KAK0706195.1 hypothetical protein B0T26DRAFT_725748 [Lasiosphaeria miniovina]